MYEEGNKRISLNWGSLIIKLLVLAIVLFIAGWLFVKVINNDTTKKTTTLAANNSDYIANINTMKTAAFEYFTTSKLPEKVGGTEKITLAQMINQKLLIDFTEDGKVCNTNTSYIQATKMADNNYALKVSLDCDEKSDFIVTTIEKESSSKSENSDIVIDNTNKNNTTSSSSSSNSNSSSSKNNSSSSSTSGSSSNSGSSSSSNKNTTTTTTTVKTSVTVKVSFDCTSTCCQSYCKPSEDKKDDTTPTTPSKPEEPKKATYYKYIKYSDWADGKSYSENAENKKIAYTTYNYCKVYSDTYYSTGYVTDTTKTGKYEYEVQYLELPSDVNSVAVVNSSKSYFSSGLTDYKAYIKNRGNLYMTGNTGLYNVSITNPTLFRESSLKKSNFSYTISGAYYNKAVKEWATTITINYKNLYGVEPYYASNLAKNVYFVPVKWDIEYTRDSKCYRDTEENKNKYTDYSISDPETSYKWVHRTYEYKWSTETSLDGYTYTGIKEERSI